MSDTDPLTAAIGTVPPLTRDQRRRCARLVATLAASTAECRHILDMLGLDPADGKSGAVSEVTA